MIIINNKEIRNTVEQVKKNKKDIAELQQGGGGITVDAYTKAEADAKFQTITGMSSYVSKTNLTDFSINDIIVADSEIQSGEVELRAVSAQDVKSEVSLDPTSAIIKTTSGTNNSTIGVSGTEVDISTGILKYNSNEVLNADSDGNLNKTLIRTSKVTSLSGEDTDSKGEITLGSGLRHGSAYIYAGGEESGASVYVRGTSSVDSEGIVEISGQTTFNTENRIIVDDGSTINQIAYLSDIVASSVNVHYINIRNNPYFDINLTLITNSSTPFNYLTLDNYFRTNSLTVAASGYFRSDDPAYYPISKVYVSAEDNRIAMEYIKTNMKMLFTFTGNETYTDTVITVKAI